MCQSIWTRFSHKKVWCFATLLVMSYGLIRLEKYSFDGASTVNLSYQKKIYRFLQWTPMNIVVETNPQVLFTMHLYSVWYLLMSVMFNSFPSKTWPLLTSSQKIFIGGVPVVTLHSFMTYVPSMTVTFWTCSTEGGSTGNKFQDVTCCRYSFFNKNKTEKKPKAIHFNKTLFGFLLWKYIWILCW